MPTRFLAVYSSDDEFHACMRESLLSQDPPKPLGDTWETHCHLVKHFPRPSEHSVLSDTAVPGESDLAGFSDGGLECLDDLSAPRLVMSSERSIGSGLCFCCGGHGYREETLGSFTCGACRGTGVASDSVSVIPGQPLNSAVVGILVTRGPDWQYGNDDGGTFGETIEDDGGGWVEVRWSNGSIGEYRVGFGSRYDLLVCQ